MNPDNYTDDAELVQLRLQLHHEKNRADSLWEIVKFERAERQMLQAEVERLTALVENNLNSSKIAMGKADAVLRERDTLIGEVKRLKADNEELRNRCDFLEGRNKE